EEPPPELLRREPERGEIEGDRWTSRARHGPAALLRGALPCHGPPAIAGKEDRRCYHPRHREGCQSTLNPAGPARSPALRPGSTRACPLQIAKSASARSFPA